MSKLRVAGGTVNQIPLDWENNLSNIQSCIEAAKKDNVDILVLPELCLSGYGCEDLFLSDWVATKSIEKLLSLLPDTNEIGIVIGLPLQLEGKTYNASCFIYNKEIKGFYLKQNLANDGIYYERRWFVPGKPGEQVAIEIEGAEYPAGELIFEIKGIKIGLEICEDIWVENRPACRLQDQGVQLILNSSASHFSFGKSLERQELIEASSKNFNCAYVYANLLGNESGQILFDGDIIIAQNGNILCKGSTFGLDQSRILWTDLEFEKPVPQGIKKIKNSPLVEFQDAVCMGLFDYLRKSKSKGFTVSLSGGADSATCAALAYLSIRRGVEELGLQQFIERIQRSDLLEKVDSLAPDDQMKMLLKELLILAYQETENSSEASLDAARNLAKELHATFLEWNIDSVINQYVNIIEDNLGVSLNWENHDLVLQNIQARSRSPIIWILANMKNYLLLVTSNRSEGSVGYATMDGDTSGSLAPIAGVSKEFIKKWLVWAEKEFELKSLRKIISLKPSAELRPLSEKQTDEEDLMPYELLQRIEELAVRHKLSPKQCFETLKGVMSLPDVELLGHVIKFYKLLARSQWKRQRFAPGFHLDEYNLNPASWFRFPILSSSFEEEISELEEIIRNSN